MFFVSSRAWDKEKILIPPWGLRFDSLWGLRSVVPRVWQGENIFLAILIVFNSDGNINSDAKVKYNFPLSLNFILLLFIDNLVREQVYFVLFSPCTLRFQLKFAEKIVFPLSVLNVIYAFYNNQSRNHLIKTWWHICLLHQALLAAPSKAALYLVQKMIHKSAHSDWRWLRFVFINA